MALKILLLATLLVLSNAEARPSAPSPGAAASLKLIEIAGYSFDPLADAVPVPAHLRTEPAATGSSWWLVQLHRSPTRADRVDLKKRFALQLARYVPEHTYVEKMDVARVRELRNESTVRAVVAHQPAYRISPALRVSAQKRVIVTLFDTTDTGRVVAQLRDLGATSIDARRGRIRCELADGRHVTDIARIEAVRWIEAQPVRDEDSPDNPRKP